VEAVTTSRGAFAARTSPPRVVIGVCDSASRVVGSSGSASERFVLATASARHLPVLRKQRALTDKI